MWYEYIFATLQAILRILQIVYGFFHVLEYQTICLRISAGEKVKLCHNRACDVPLFLTKNSMELYCS